MVKRTADDVDRIVAQWAQVRPELDTAGMALFGRIDRLARLVGDRQEKAYTRYGVDRGEFEVLAALRAAGAPYQMSPKALIASLSLTSGGMTSRLDRLEHAGLIVRSPDPADRRTLIIALTQAGLHLVDDAVVAGLAAQQEAIGGLPRRSREQLNDLLRELLAGAER